MRSSSSSSRNSTGGGGGASRRRKCPACGAAIAPTRRSRRGRTRSRGSRRAIQSGG
jgi:hypothetical protein